MRIKSFDNTLALDEFMWYNHNVRKNIGVKVLPGCSVHAGHCLCRFSGGMELFVNEIDVLKRAKYYMDSLSSGTNPITGEPLAYDCEIAADNFYKCFAYISEVLEKEINKSAHTDESRGKREEFYLSDEDMEKVLITDDHVGINTVAARINDVIDRDVMKGVSGGKLAECLVSMGYLKLDTLPNGNTVRVASDMGVLAGIETQNRTDTVGKAYMQNVYSKQMQEFLVKNINEIMKHSVPKREKPRFVYETDASKNYELPDDEDYYGI